jgi:dolichol-phosphate mannosyltransferase
MTFTGLAGAAVSFLTGLAFLAYKLLFWSHFEVGVAPMVIGASFAFSIQLLFMGLIGEYVGAIHTQLQRRPWAIERERVNFEYEPGPAATVVDSVGTVEKRRRPAPSPLEVGHST